MILIEQTLVSKTQLKVFQVMKISLKILANYEGNLQKEEYIGKLNGIASR